MRVIVCGAGMVGANIAQFLAAEGNDVTVIESDPSISAHIAATMDVQTVVGHATLPDVLQQAGAGNCDMIVAVTQNDEVNMIACQVADALFQVPNKVARIRHRSFLNPAWANLFSRDNIRIDTIISPEIEVAEAIARRLHVPGAFDTATFCNNRVRMLGLMIRPDCPVINTPLRQMIALFPDLIGTITGIVRNDRSFIPSVDDMLLPGDEVYIVCDENHTSRIMAVLGHTETEARHVVIAGGGNIGLYLSQIIEREFRDVSVRLIERGQDRAEYVAELLKKTVVLNGDALDFEILDEAQVSNSETIVTVTDDDETNILASLLAKRQGCQRAITLVNKSTYAPLLHNLGINAVVNPRMITVSRILQQVRRGRIRSVYNLSAGFAEILEAEALENSPVTNKPLSEIRLPEGVVIGLLVEKGEVMRPWPNAVIRAGMTVILMASKGHVHSIEGMFTPAQRYY